MAKQSRPRVPGETDDVMDPSPTESMTTSRPEPSMATATMEPPVSRQDRPAGPTVEQIQARAYEIYVARKGAPGNPQVDWLQAERELRSKKRS